MRPYDFCYWIQGSFELNPGEGAMSPSQVRAVAKRLAEVAKAEAAMGPSPAASSKFCQWLEGFLEARELIDPGKPLDGGQLSLVKAKLADAFILDIDRSYGGEELQERLSGIHRGRGEDRGLPPGVQAMC